MQFLEELKKRSVIRVATLYVVASWLILQVGDVIFDAFDVPSWSIRLLIAILILGFPIALGLSWVFELTTDGLVREAEVDRGAVRRLSRRRVYVLTAAMLVLGVVILLAKGTFLDAVPDDRSIAVLPFVNISDDPSNEYFSDGMSEELLNLLAGLPELRVTARTSSFSFKDKDFDIPTIGRLLNVAHVLEGSVRKSGKQLRITAQLINVESGFHIWSQTYDREMDDIFAIQDDISEAVVAALRISILGEAPRARATDPDAFTAYLNALHFYQQRTNEGYEKAAHYSQQAIDIDPGYAPAWNLLSSTYSNQALSGQIPYGEANDKALLAVERALEIDPNFAYANSARAWLAMNYERDYSTAAAFSRRALDLAPENPVILGNRAVLAYTLGHVDKAIEMTQKSVALNPVSTTAYSNLSDQLAGAGRPVDAIEAAHKAVELMPRNPTARVNLAAAYLLAEQPEKALEEVDKVDWEIYQLFIKTLAYDVLDQVAESNNALNQMTERYADARALRIASAYAWRNDLDVAFQWLDRAVSEGQPTNGVKNDPFLRNLHGDARWDLLLERLGLSDEQVEAIEF